MMRHLEDNLQKACVRWFRYQYPDILIHHSPNGGFRTSIEGAKFKAMGTLAGFADLVILAQRGGSGALFIEMKSDKGRQSDYQKQFEEYCKAAGYTYCVVRTIDEFMESVNRYLG